MTVRTPLAIALLVLVAALGWSAPARALPTGAVLDRVDLSLKIPKTRKQDPKMTTQWEMVLHVSGNYWGTYKLEVDTTRMVALQDGSPVRNVYKRYRTVDDYRVPYFQITANRAGPTSQITFRWTGPLFKNAFARFWWHRTDAILTFPFRSELKPVRQGMMVRVVAPYAKGDTGFPAQPKGYGWKCVKDNLLPQLQCERWLPAARVAKLKDKAKNGLRIRAVKVTGSRSEMLAAAQVGLWLLLFPIVGFWATTTRPFEKGEKLWLFARLFFVGIPILLFGVAAFWFLADGVTDDFMETNITYAAGVYGVTGMLIGLVRNANSAARTWLFRVIVLLAVPLSVVILYFAESAMGALVTLGVGVGGGFILMFAQNNQ